MICGHQMNLKVNLGKADCFITINCLDTRASVQHKFLSREKLNGESIPHFLTYLKILSVNCNFNCPCGKSICEILLTLQLIRGSSDPEIRTRILQEREI